MSEGTEAKTKKCCLCCTVPDVEGEKEEDCCDMPCCLFAPYKDHPTLKNPPCNYLRTSQGARIIFGCILGFILGMLITLARPVKPSDRFCFADVGALNFQAQTMDDTCYHYGVSSSNTSISPSDILILEKELPLCLDRVCTRKINIVNNPSNDVSICYAESNEELVSTIAVGDHHCSKLENLATSADYSTNEMKYHKFYVNSVADLPVDINQRTMRLCLEVIPGVRTASISFGLSCPTGTGKYDFQVMVENEATGSAAQDTYTEEKMEFENLMDYIFKFWADLWLNALKLIVMPLLIANIITSTSDITEVPNSGKLACYTFLYYVTTTLFAALEALILCTMVLLPFMKQVGFEKKDYTQPNKAYADTGSQVVSVFNAMVPTNIVQAFVGNNFLGIIFFCIIVGITLPRKTTNGETGVFLQWFQELNIMMMKIVQVIINFTPLGVFLFSAYVYAIHDIDFILPKASLFLTAVFLGLAFHLFVVYPMLYWLLTRKNPYWFMYNTLDAALLALTISSSAATWPVTLKCAIEKNHIREEIAKFVTSLGATINMDGTTIGFPCAIIFIAYGEGIELTFSQMIMVVLLSTVSSMGAAPIPQAGLVLLMVILENLSIPMETAFYIVLSVDWLYDRPETMVNVVGDSFAAGIMDHHFGPAFDKRAAEDAADKEEKS